MCAIYHLALVRKIDQLMRTIFVNMCARVNFSKLCEQFSNCAQEFVNCSREVKEVNCVRDLVNFAHKLVNCACE